uniref:Uncharacterized protein n=1 Tax=Panagrolaimus sp. JU765 TaxID=591449 RepID=A0AC34QSD7_9BILA
MEAQTEVVEVGYDGNIDAEPVPVPVHKWNPVEKPTTAEMLKHDDVVAVDLDKSMNEFVLESNDGLEQLNDGVNGDIGAVYWGKSMNDVVFESQDELSRNTIE